MSTYTPRYTTLAAVRQALRIPDSPAAADWRHGGQGDVSLLATIRAAEAQVDEICGRSFAQPNVVPSTRRFPVDVSTYTTADSHIAQPPIPVDDFVPAGDDVLRFQPQGGAWVPLTADEWEPLYQHTPRDVASFVVLWPNTVTPSNIGRLELTAHWGWSSVPSQVGEAAKLLSARLAQREASPLGVTSVNDVGMYISRVDHDVRALLAPWAGSKIGVA